MRLSPLISEEQVFTLSLKRQLPSSKVASGSKFNAPMYVQPGTSQLIKSHAPLSNVAAGSKLHAAAYMHPTTSSDDFHFSAACSVCGMQPESLTSHRIPRPPIRSLLHWCRPMQSNRRRFHPIHSGFRINVWLAVALSMPATGQPLPGSAFQSPMISNKSKSVGVP